MKRFRTTHSVALGPQTPGPRVHRLQVSGRARPLVSTLILALALGPALAADAAPARRPARKIARPAAKAAAAKPAATKPAAAQPTGPQRPEEVLDVEKLRAVKVGKHPQSVQTCDVLIVGGGLGGVAAAEAMARQGLTVIMSEPTSWIGGQLTAQAVSCPDENSYIEQNPGVGTRSYRELRQQLRDYYAAQPGIKPGRQQSVGSCWVSRVSGEPKVWEELIRRRLEPLQRPNGIRDILTRHTLVEIRRFPHNERYHYADLVNLDDGRITRVAAKYLLDATEWGDGLEKANLPHVIGAEARSQYGESLAPEQARPDWVQSFTYCFLVRWQPEGPWQKVDKPAEYEYFKSLGEYTLGYDYAPPRGRVFYKVFERVPNSGGPFWTYRRVIAANNFVGNPQYQQDIALINWRGNDFHEENPVGKPLHEQIRILKRSKAFAQGFLYWLQNECPRDDGQGYGYPEMQLALDQVPTDDGFAPHPYIRESRRLQSAFMLTQQHMDRDPNNPDKKWGEEFFDTVGIALYAMDIHPAKGEPPMLAPALPYHIPLGSFITKSGARNVLPAAKNFGATRVALSSARMHPTEWLAGEVAGNLASFCIRHRIDPQTVRDTPELLQKFQSELEQSGVPLRWRDIIR